MKRPLADKRPFGPFAQRDDPEPTGVSIEKGPIITKLEVTTFTGDRKNSPNVTQDHVDFVDSEVKRIITQPEVKERLDFAGELNEFDVFTFSETDITISSYIRHPEDILSIVFLEELVDVFQANINSNKDLTVRSYDVVSREFVEQKHPVVL